MDAQYDVIIVGAGSVGAAAGYYLSEKGVRTLLIDAHDPPHSYGSHHGHTRIIRHAYGDCKSTAETIRKQPYIPLSLEAHELWLELERVSGQRLLYETGLLDIAKADSPRLQSVVETARSFQIPVKRFHSAELNEAWPGLRVPDGFTGCLETKAGILMSEACILAYLEQAVAHGAHIVTNSAVQDIAFHRDSVTVRTSAAEFHGSSVIVCAGGWTEKLLAPLDLQLTHVRKAVAFYNAGSGTARFTHESFPALFFDLETESYYAIPDVDGCGLKVGRHDGGQIFHLQEGMPSFGAYAEDITDMNRFMEQFMSAETSSFLYGGVCQYTLTQDEDFIVDFHPEHRNAIVATGFGGHGFKFASVIGKKISEMAVTGRPQRQLEPFSLDRWTAAAEPAYEYYI